MSVQSSTRLDYLDAVRSFALILGIVFHAALSFMPIFIGWAVMDISTSEWVSIFALISHSFRMALFFLIAGFFAHMKFHQLGAKAFFESRLVRLAIPFVVGWFVLRPLLVSGWVMGAQSLQGDVDIVSGLVAGLSRLTELPNELFVGTHLWFLYYLILISLSVVLIRALLGTKHAVLHHLSLFSDRVLRWLCQSRFCLMLVALPTATCLWFMDNWGMDTPDKSLIPHVPVSLIYSGFFLFGWLLHRQSELLEQFARVSWGKVLLCLVAVIATVFLSVYQGKPGHPQYLQFKTAFLLSYAIMMWSLVSLSIGICKRLFSRPSRTVRYIADSSYWLYLIHLPIVVWLQVGFAELSWHWSIKWFGICAITLVASLVLYHVFVRPTFIGVLLNGKRKGRKILVPHN